MYMPTQLANIKILFLSSVAGLVLSGCVLTDFLGGGGSNVWNSKLGKLNDEISCPQSGVAQDAVASADDSKYPWATTGLMNKNDWISVYFKTDRAGASHKPGDTTFNYFPLAREFPVTATSVDHAIEIFLDETFDGWDYGTGGQPDTPANKAWGTLLVPMVTQGDNRKTWTEIRGYGGGSTASSLARWPRSSESEVYFLNDALYCGYKKMSDFDPYVAVSSENFPALIYILYKPEKYALYPNSTERQQARMGDGTSFVNTSAGLLFDVYYSVYHYNRFFTEPDGKNIKTCDIKKYTLHGIDITPPWQLGTCLK